MFDIGFWMPESVNSLAQGTDSLFMFILWVSVISLVIVCGSMVFLAIRYRASSNASRDKPPKDHLGLEVAWTLIPTIILAVIFYWGSRDYVRMSIPQAEAMEVRVLGQKWFWTFEYPEHGIRLQATEEMNTKNTRDGKPVGLVVPVNTPVRLVGSSADVLHSVYIPSFRMKKDVVPNRYTVTGFRATKEGVYDLFCTEYCGTKHSGMITKVTVLSQAEFASFIEDAKTAAESPIDGETLFARSGCAGCHSVTVDPPPGGIGPALYGVFGRQERLTTGDTIVVDENYLRESIENPIAKVVEGYGPVMPSYAGRLSEEELTALIVYLKGLGHNKGGLN